jgi:Zn-dependent peptidase ImmA (M78 family)
MKRRYQRKTKTELERLASGFLKNKGSFVDGSKLQIEELIEHLGFDIYPVPGLSKFAEGFLPRAGKRIYVDENQMIRYELRYRFTLSEELGHHLLIEEVFKGKSEKEIAAAIDSFDGDEYCDFERNAKYLAGSLLMPRNEFIERFKALEALFSESSRSRKGVLYSVIRELGKEFCVSDQSVGIRARMLGLVKEEDLGGL